MSKIVWSDVFFQSSYALSVIKPLDYYYPPKELLEQMIEKGTVQSVKYTLALRDKYCR
ncbi:hypothetical protein ACIQX3_22700 [Peribacillus frigoritolerans]|uniref:hypothetical protein n=1 Tax=Peribacillus frigoritolerans TaxID=450367 RepID=UPI003824C40B